MMASNSTDPMAAPIIDLVPGTEIMQEGAGHKTKGHTVLVPHPSNDPSDPLNWSTVRKLLVAGTLFLYSFLTTTCALSMAPMFGLFAVSFDMTETQVPLIVGATIMVLGFSNFIVIPFSNVFGRRAAALVFGLLFLGCCIWQAAAQSYGSFMAARALVGIAAAPSETLMVQVIGDIFFLHERGFYTTGYFTSLVSGATIGPVISGTLAAHHGWRSFFWLSTGLTGLILIMVLIFFPETKYNRDRPDAAAAVVTTRPSDEEVADKAGKADFPAEHAEAPGAPSSLVGRGRPSKQQFLLIQKPHPQWKSFLVHDFVAPVRVAFFPIIFFAALNLAGPSNLLLFFNLTEHATLGGPPYNFTVAQVGYSNFAFTIGAFVGLAVAGPFSDWVCKKATERNGGIREAEMRLPALIPFFFLTIICSVVGGVGLDRQWSWPIILVFGYGLSGVLVTSVTPIAIAYAVDSYKPVAGEIMIVGTVVKNTTGFAMTYWMPPMAARDGYLTPLMVWFVFTIGPILLAVPLYFWGKKLRTLTRHSPVHTYESIL